MISLKVLWDKLSSGWRYRAEFATQFTKQAIAHQIDSLLRQHKLTQAELAKRSGLTQGVVSRAADPEYGKLTINTLVRIAAGFDTVFVGAFVPFSDLPLWFERFYEQPFRVLGFHQEQGAAREMDSLYDTEGLPANVLPFARMTFTRRPPRRVPAKKYEVQSETKS